MKLNAHDLTWNQADTNLRDLKVPDADIARLMAKADRFPGKPQEFRGEHVKVTVTMKDRKYSVKAE